MTRALIEKERTTCSRWFEGWQAALEFSEHLWNVRDVNGDLAWRNQNLREFTGIQDTVVSWGTAIRNVLIEDVLRMEDAHSLCLKTKKAQELRIRIRRNPHQVALVSILCLSSVCKGCSKQCGVVLTQVVPLDEPI